MHLLAHAASLLLLTLGVASQRDKGTTLRQAAEKKRLMVGTAAASYFFEEGDYQRILGSEFSVLEPENEMKFASIHPRVDTDAAPYDFKGADALVAFAAAHKMKVRGHTLVWHNQQPRWVTAGGLTPVQLSDILHKHIDTVVGRYARKIFAWDVVNEAFNDDGSLRHTVWFDRPGIGLAGEGAKYMEQAFRWAHDADRRAKLFYNDYSAETVNRKSDAIYAMAKDFKARRVPIDGVGFQMHLDLSFDKPETLHSFRDNLKRFADLGLDIHLTEMDIRLPNDNPASLAAQAKLYRDITEICMQQPRVKLLQIWGFTDKHSWIPGFYRGQGWALLWDEKYEKKPAYGAMIDALEGRR